MSIISPARKETATQTSNELFMFTAGLATGIAVTMLLAMAVYMALQVKTESPPPPPKPSGSPGTVCVDSHTPIG